MEAVRRDELERILDAPIDDVTTVPAWLGPGRLHDALQALDAPDVQLTRLYRHYDRRAVRHYRVHIALAALAALLGFMAVVFALRGLPEEGAQVFRSVPPQLEHVPSPEPKPRTKWGAYEVLTMSLAAAAVGFALFAATAHGWLLNRHKAERLRRLKYEFLTSPALWAGDEDRRRQREERLGRDIEAIGLLTWRDLEGYVEHESLPHVESVPTPEYDAGALESLRRYYREIRLRSQRAYLARRSGPRHPLDRLTRKVPQALFFLAVVVVLLHFWLEHYHWITREQGLWLVVAAVAFPAFGAAIRTFRVSNEFDRNQLRSRAKGVALGYLADQAAAAELGNELFDALARCEAVIESDHREWLRLMIEAEWFG